jgi:hypothetical protein
MTYPQPEDWPTDEETERRMPAIMQNGGDGAHHEELRGNKDDLMSDLPE